MVMLKAAAVPVLLDALLERGRATWPGVGEFELVASSRPSQHGPVVHVFPTRKVEFTADPAHLAALRRFLEANGGRVSVAGFGSFAAPDCTFTPEPTLVALVRAAPRLLLRPEVGPAPPPHAPSVVASAPAAPRRPWWRRLFGNFR